MANIASQKKRIHRTEREKTENRRFQGAVRTHFRRLESAVASGDSDAIESELGADGGGEPGGPETNASHPAVTLSDTSGL